MTRKFLLTIFLSVSAVSIAAQSGRIKPTETPTPKSELPRPSVVYMPTQPVVVKPLPTPGTSRKTEVDDDVISIESNLVPIPVSVLNAHGEPVTNLKLEDFSLRIDEQAAEIGELTRSETPVRLALLFDNSSSATLAREFEIKAAVRFFPARHSPDERFSRALFGFERDAP
jgi:hypothetical protein